MARFEVRPAAGSVPTVYPDRSNTVDLLVYRDGALLDLSTATRWVFEMAGVVVDSADYPAAFVLGGGTGELSLALGAFAYEAGRYGAKLTLYSPTYPLGVVLTSALYLSVAARATAAQAFTTGGVVFVSGSGAKWLFYLSAGVPSVAEYTGDLAGITELTFTDLSGTRYRVAVADDGTITTEAV